MKALIESGKKTVGVLLDVLVTILWLIFCGIPTGLLYLVHFIWISRRFIRQLITKKPQYLDSPAYGLIEILIFLPVILSKVP